MRDLNLTRPIDVLAAGSLLLMISGCSGTTTDADGSDRPGRLDGSSGQDQGAPISTKVTPGTSQDDAEQPTSSNDPGADGSPAAIEVCLSIRLCDPDHFADEFGSTAACETHYTEYLDEFIMGADLECHGAVEEYWECAALVYRDSCNYDDLFSACGDLVHRMYDVCFEDYDEYDHVDCYYEPDCNEYG